MQLYVYQTKMNSHPIVFLRAVFMKKALLLSNMLEHSLETSFHQLDNSIAVTKATIQQVGHLGKRFFFRKNYWGKNRNKRIIELKEDMI